MKELVVVSGKGGTGKTSMVSALASLSKNKVLCDADVDASDLHLIMHPQNKEDHEFFAGHVPRIDTQVCTQCGLCKMNCRWHAIDDNFTIDLIACEGCGVCYYICPEQAILFDENKCGHWYIANSRFGHMVFAKLGIAEENSGKLVTLVRQEANKLAQQKQLDFILTDGPPGIGCPVIASIGGATLVLIVTEPTIAGLHDLKRIIELTKHFKIPSRVCINKYDINLKMSQEIESTAEANDSKVIGKIPFDPFFTKAMVEGKTIFEYDPENSICKTITTMWDCLWNEISESNN